MISYKFKPFIGRQFAWNYCEIFYTGKILSNLVSQEWYFFQILAVSARAQNTVAVCHEIVSQCEWELALFVSLFNHQHSRVMRKTEWQSTRPCHFIFTHASLCQTALQNILYPALACPYISTMRLHACLRGSVLHRRLTRACLKWTTIPSLSFFVTLEHIVYSASSMPFFLRCNLVKSFITVW